MCTHDNESLARTSVHPPPTIRTISTVSPLRNSVAAKLSRKITSPFNSTTVANGDTPSCISNSSKLLGVLSSISPPFTFICHVLDISYLNICVS